MQEAFTIPYLFNISSRLLYFSVAPNANFSRKCDIPEGCATSYRDPESMTTPTVQNWPNFASVATRRPFDNVVT